MRLKIIKKDRIRDLLKEAALAWNVYAPQRNLGEDVWFDKLPKAGKPLKYALNRIVLDDADTVISPKDIFFPQLESIFEFRKGKIRETVESSAKLLFGIRPCDLKGMLFSDDFYRRDYEDKYYSSRIQNRFVVVKGCVKPPRPTCFCSSAKTGPFADKGFDLQLIEKAESYLVEIGSKKGDLFVKKYAKFFGNCPAKENKACGQIKKKSAGALELKVDFARAVKLMARNDFVPEENYARIGERCIYCGACLYVCPTCTCFNVSDNIKDDSGSRVRNWDACVFEGYTRETSGHNPRKEKWQRTSRRYEHKLKFDYKTTGTSGCVACGRCLSSCPVDIGISKFIQEITQDKKIM